MADLIYMTKAAWTAITDKVRGKTGSTGLLKAGEVPGVLNELLNVSALFDGAGIKEISNDTVTSIKDACCMDFKELQNVSVTAATIIGDNAFSGCTSLTRLNAPKATYIGQLAFANGPSIRNLLLPKAESIQYGAFEL